MSRRHDRGRTDREILIWRARRVDAHWEGGWSVLGDDRLRDADAFRRAVRRVASGVLPQMVQDEVSLRALHGQRGLDPDAIVEDVLEQELARLDPEDGVRLAVVKLQLAALELIDDRVRDDLMDHPEVLEQEFVDPHGVVGFL